ncbi:hypothetical protein GQ602_006841 [Ophiocordyceps camponoti-floridani]|uniref:Uncharacterized protein n=1 Tax=Ophiocordyceps camponoti-floridani TaxID=2030778 RepID=A0A8H4Q1Y9_9HYPO|nr:hypothetical protein GQ602_006841 [Ophiocordyceps camponoti-floridani]
MDELGTLSDAMDNDLGVSPLRNAIDNHITSQLPNTTEGKRLSLGEQLANTQSLSSIRSLAGQALPFQQSPTPHAVLVSLTIALRVVTLTCQTMDSLLARQGAEETGAFQDTGIYRQCAKTACPDRVAYNLDELVPMVGVATRYLEELDAFPGYADVVVELIQRSAFDDESDDLVIHRCLLATHLCAETYMRSLQSQLPTPSTRPSRPRYPKGDVKKAIVRTTRGPILGHHQVITLNCAACTDDGMDPALAFTAYADNLCWFNDWATAERKDGDALAAINASLSNNPYRPEVDYPWRRRNRLADAPTRWLALLDSVAKDDSNSHLKHSSSLCKTPLPLRRLILASVCYGSWHMFPMPRVMTLDGYARDMCAMMGIMIRGWLIDHDSEASIGEHCLMNWLCRECSVSASRETISPANALALRDDDEMRLAYGPLSYFFFSRRHRGFTRRVDNHVDSFSGRELPVRECEPACHPVVAGDDVEAITSKILALCGLQLLGPPRLDEEDWNCRPRICRACDFPGSRQQLFIISVGLERLATALPAHVRPRLVRLVEQYGFRLFPAVQARMLTLCPCLSRWTADIQSYSYQQSGFTCGQSDCSIASSDKPEALDDEESDDGRFEEMLLRQTEVEAAAYSHKTGQAAWLAVVSCPLRSWIGGSNGVQDGKGKL